MSSIPTATATHPPPASGVCPPRRAARICRGVCPASQHGAPVTCEGACSACAAWAVERRHEDRALGRLVAAIWRQAIGGQLLSLLVVGALLLGCARDGEAKAAATTFTLTVKAPAPVKPGELATATIQVVPRKPYKINLEFPMRLKVTGPAAAAPRELQLTPQQAAKLTAAELLLKPAFKVGAKGSHAFQGTLRFSVCTDAQCEIKTETVSWTAVCR